MLASMSSPSTTLLTVIVGGGGLINRGGGLEKLGKFSENFESKHREGVKWL